MKRILLVLFFSLVASSVIAAPIPVATYNFNNNLNAEEQGVGALTAIDPLGNNGFVTDTVMGINRTVYSFDGNRTPVNEQAGLVFDSAGLITGDSYSIEMIFAFTSSPQDSSWESIVNVSNRQSDNAFYVDPGQKLEVFPSGDGPTTFTFGEYHHVTLTNDGNGKVTSYLDGVFQFNLSTTSMDFSSFSTQNPNRLIHFFVDNVIGGGQGEFSDGRVALIRIYDVELDQDTVGDLAVPEPSSWLLFSFAFFCAIGLRRKK